VDFKAILRWNMTPTDLEEWASFAPAEGENLPLEESYRVLLDPIMVQASPTLGATVIKVRHRIRLTSLFSCN
jgi:hypothetical protein